MNEGIIAQRYAKALFKLSKEKNLIDDVYNDMSTLIDAEKTVPEFISFLNTPIVSVSEKERILTQTFSNHFNKISLSFISLLLKNRREMFLINMALKYINLYKEFKGIKSVLLITTNPASKATKDKMIKLVSDAFKCKSDLIEKQDEKIIGGFILRVEDQQFDASIASKIKRIKQELISTRVG